MTKPMTSPNPAARVVPSIPLSNDEAVAFLTVCADYFERRPTDGEDAAHWSNVSNGHMCRKIAAMLSAAKPPASGVAVAVKALHWVKSRSCKDDKQADTDLGQYCVGLVHGSYVALRRHVRAGQLHDDVLARGLGFEDAKAVCQSDYGQRIRSALSPAPTSGSEAEPVAWRSVLTDMLAAMQRYGHEVGDGDIPSAHRNLMSRAEQLLAKPASSPAGGDVREAFETCAAICEARADYFDRASGYREWTDAARSYRATAKEIRERAALSASTSAAEPVAFQQRVQPWMMACFGAEISADVAERNHRFLEEALELVQSTGCTASEAHQLVDYVYGRDIGETHQEIGGVMVTLAALCLALSQDMHAAGETELARIWTKVEKIRAKQAAKPKHSPLPQHVATPPAPAAVDGQKVKEAMRWVDDNLRAAKRAMKVSTERGDLRANFAAHDAHKHLGTIRACLATDKEGA